MLGLRLRTCRSGSVAALISCILARKRGPWSPSLLCCPFVKTYAWIISCSSTSCPARNESAAGQASDLHTSSSSLTYFMHELQPAACHPRSTARSMAHTQAMLRWCEQCWSGECTPTLGHSRCLLQHRGHNQRSPTAAADRNFYGGQVSLYVVGSDAIGSPSGHQMSCTSGWVRRA